MFFCMYVLSFFKKGDTIQGGTLFKGGHYLRKYGTYFFSGAAEAVGQVFLVLKALKKYIII